MLGAMDIYLDVSRLFLHMVDILDRIARGTSNNVLSASGPLCSCSQGRRVVGHASSAATVGDAEGVARILRVVATLAWNASIVALDAVGVKDRLATNNT